MIIEPAIYRPPTPNPSANQDRPLPSARRGGSAIAPASRATEPQEQGLLAYADFVLDQEAQYCQQ